MAESLLSPSNILLYGRELMDFRLVAPAAAKRAATHNEPPPDGSQLDDIKPDPPCSQLPPCRRHRRRHV